MSATPRNDGERWRNVEGGVAPRGTRNKRTVWTIPTSPYSGAHFATFPPALVEPCILAGTSARGVCAVCGAPWERVVDKGELVPTSHNYDKRAYGVVRDNPDAQDQGSNRARDGHRSKMAYENKTVGWLPSCDCGDPCDPPNAVPAVVLDPFCGSGTTGQVARLHGRRFVGLDISREYLATLALARAENTQTAASMASLPLFAPAAGG